MFFFRFYAYYIEGLGLTTAPVPLTLFLTLFLYYYYKLSTSPRHYAVATLQLSFLLQYKNYLFTQLTKPV